jgi:hypothetical protein
MTPGTLQAPRHLSRPAGIYALALFSLSLQAALLPVAHSAPYSLAPAAFNAGSAHAASLNYTADFSSSDGGTATSDSYTLLGGYTGRLSDMTSDFSLAAGFVAEDTGGQLRVWQIWDDSSLTAHPGSIIWTIQSGPLLTIASNGLVAADIVYQDTPAVVQAAYQGVTRTITFTVKNTLIDNYSPYAGDNLDDAWQIQTFGLVKPPNSGPSDDFDGDGLSNLLEFAFGTAANSNSSGAPALAFSGSFANATLSATGQPVVGFEPTAEDVDFRAVFIRRVNHAEANLRYSPEFSANLVQWFSVNTTPAVLGTNTDVQLVSVPYPHFLPNGKKAKFFRIRVEVEP